MMTPANVVWIARGDFGDYVDFAANGPMHDAFPSLQWTRYVLAPAPAPAAEPPQAVPEQRQMAQDRKEVMQSGAGMETGQDAVTGGAHPHHAEPPQDVAGIDDDRLLDNAATCSQVREMLQEDYTNEDRPLRECVRLNVIAPYRAALAAMGDDLERERVRLAACGVAAMQNTRTSAANGRMARDAWAWSASYADVCRAVDSQMDERERAEQAERKFEQAEMDHYAAREHIEQLKRKLGQAERERDEAREDAERYRWLREEREGVEINLQEEMMGGGFDPDGPWYEKHGTDLDAAIDAARRSGSKPNEGGK